MGREVELHRLHGIDKRFHERPDLVRDIGSRTVLLDELHNRAADDDTVRAIYRAFIG